MQNQLRETTDKVTELETLQWCDISTHFPIADDISDYVASDEESDAEDGKGVEDVWYLTPTQSDEGDSSSSNEVDFDVLEEEFWFSSLAPQLMGEEVPESALPESSNSFWRSLETPGFQGLSSNSDVETQGGAWGMRPLPDQEHYDDCQCREAFDVAEKCRLLHSSDSNSNLQLQNSHHSDSEGSDVHSIESAQVSTLKQFQNDVTALLNLLMDEKFAHPYGTIAGSVA